MPACRRALVHLADQALLDRVGLGDPSTPVKGFASAGAPAWYAPDLPLLPVQLELAATLDFEGRALDGQLLTHLQATRDGARSLRLDAVGLDINQVNDADGAELSWHYDGMAIAVTWADGVARGQTRRLVVQWRVSDPMTGLKFGAADGPAWAGTDHETERARYWLPCVDHPSVRPHVQVALRGPAVYTYLSAGQRQGELTHDDGSKTVTWKLDHPCPSYLLCFFAGDIVQADGGEHQGKPVRFFAPAPLTAEDLNRSFGRTVEFLDWMTDKLQQPLPWPKYFQFAAPGIGGAMENISLVSWDDAWVADPRMHAEMGWLVDLINVHEMAHTWFGDSVVCRDFAHSWLKESWATYIESAWIEDLWGQRDLHAWLHVELRQYLGEAAGRYQRPIATRRFDSSWDLFDAHLYPGGAVRLHLLRRTLGDDVFWPAVTAYLSRNAGKVVETDTFRLIMEEFSGRSLARFFDQWFLSPGYPKLEVKTAWEGEEGRFTVTIVQAQVDAAAGIGAFEVDLDVAVELPDGEWRRVTVPLSGPRHVATLDLPARPLQVVIDPDSDVPHDISELDPGDDMLVRSLSACESVRGRVRAVEAACRLGRPALLAAVGAAYRDESSWILRRLIAQSLGDCKVGAAAGLLAELLLQEADPKVMGVLAQACGKHRDPRIAAALVTWLSRPEQPWIASQHALTALGAQRGDAHLDLLRAALEQDSWWDRVRQGALAGLGASRSPSALESIRPWLRQGSVQVRVAAVSALADGARWADRGLRQQVAEQLADMLLDDQYKVRLAAARALTALGEGHADAVAAVVVAGQDQPGVRRLAQKLRKGDHSVGKLEAQIEGLEQTLRKLRERLDKVDGGGE